ncbi:MAG: class I SAM-dependent methyltransferase [candidate division Zixibacteria bacterium]|nr:class I SAM-dependent methyltransferase [candidate division Zixibacteria bacterium]
MLNISANNTSQGDVGSYFDRAATSFDSLYSPQGQSALQRWVNSRFRRDIAERFVLTLAHVQRSAPGSVADIGCGSGRYIAAMAQSGVRRIVGLDLSAEMLELARQNTVRLTDAQIELVQSDYLDWKPSGLFDLIVAMGFYDYIREPQAVLARMKQQCRGSVIASFPSRHWFRTPLRQARYKLKKCPVYFYDAAQIERIGLDAGFQRVDITKVRGAGMDYVAVFWIKTPASE